MSSSNFSTFSGLNRLGLFAFVSFPLPPAFPVFLGRPDPFPVCFPRPPFPGFFLIPDPFCLDCAPEGLFSGLPGFFLPGRYNIIDIISSLYHFFDDIDTFYIDF
jgi:hypothetical protein